MAYCLFDNHKQSQDAITDDKTARVNLQDKVTNFDKLFFLITYAILSKASKIHKINNCV